jgi:tRNA(Ile)-lysidine synthase TilS/MesJ
MAVDRKIDLFFKRHVVPFFDPDQIRWWFSLSGGKDSYSMAHAVGRWYERNAAELHASSFLIDQWGGPAASGTKSNLARRLHIVDGRALTQERTKYKPGEQAPCRSCADVRRDLTDELVEHALPRDNRGLNFIARGLHLTDIAVSLIWRHAWGRDAAKELIEGSKASPVTQIKERTFLVKPLTYVREFESAAYADGCGYTPQCCGCPACKFPSRRDIVEETLCDLYEGTLWEFDVPGMRAFLNHWGGIDDAKLRSVPGRHAKHRHLPPRFSAFVVEKFREEMKGITVDWSALCDPAVDLDKLAAARMLDDAPIRPAKRLPMPGLLKNRDLTNVEQSLIATLGPFWGAFGLGSTISREAITLQTQYFGWFPDERWTQVNRLLHEFYRNRPHSKPELVLRHIPRARRN